MLSVALGLVLSVRTNRAYERFIEVPSLPIPPHLSPSLPISPHLSPSLPISAHLCPSLPISPHISPSLAISRHLSPSLPHLSEEEEISEEEISEEISEEEICRRSEEESRRDLNGNLAQSRACSSSEPGTSAGGAFSALSRPLSALSCRSRSS